MSFDKRFLSALAFGVAAAGLVYAGPAGAKVEVTLDSELDPKDPLEP